LTGGAAAGAGVTATVCGGAASAGGGAPAVVGAGSTMPDCGSTSGSSLPDDPPQACRNMTLPNTARTSRLVLM